MTRHGKQTRDPDLWPTILGALLGMVWTFAIIWEAIR